MPPGRSVEKVPLVCRRFEESSDDDMARPLVISSSGELDPAVMTTMLQRPVSRVFVRDFAKSGGLSGDFLEVVADDEIFVLKQTRNFETARNLGTWREGLFYRELAPSLTVLPRSYFGYGDETGVKQVLMEKLEGRPAGLDFGSGNPNCWGCDTRDNAKQTATESFTLYAKMHARFWMDNELLKKEWLRGSRWLQGRDEGWDDAQELAKCAWTECRGTKIEWDPHVVACLDASFEKVDFTAFYSEQRPFTLVHGDAHPHNILRVDNVGLVLIDFEMVGLGSPFQDLGQFLISHMAPVQRREAERDLLKTYREDLLAALKEAGFSSDDDKNFEKWTSLEYIFEEYIQGGAGRWLWFVPYLVKVCPPAMGQYFHDQLAAFLYDHVPDATLAPMPRV